MIRIHRNIDAPATLMQQGAQQTRVDCSDYESSPEEYTSRERSFPNKKYYSSQDVQNALREMSYSKCCYCESKVEGSGYFHVEHFRPKGAVRQGPGAPNEYPGYYWLVYFWGNLLLACPRCNTAKGALFPLENPDQRVRSHIGNLAEERALLVNPAEDNPRDHIRFDDDLPVHRSERGRHTIKGVGLRRVELREDRLEHLNGLRALANLLKNHEDNQLQNDQDVVDQARRLIKKAMAPDARFSSMVKDFVSAQGLLIDNVEHAGN